MDKEDLVIAGMDLSAEVAVLDPFVVGGGYVVPSRVWVSHSPDDSAPETGEYHDRYSTEYPRLEWRHVPGTPPHWVGDGGDCLGEFTRLRDDGREGFAERVAGFAARWGVLEICEHYRPAGHHDSCKPLANFVVSRPKRDDGLFVPESLSWEPIDAWWWLSGQLDGLLGVMASLYDGDELGRPSDWLAVERGEPVFVSRDHLDGELSTGLTIPPRIESRYTFTPDANPARGKFPNEFQSFWWRPQAGSSRDEHRQAVAASVARWQGYGRMRVRASWQPDDRSGSNVLSFSGLTGLLALQLSAGFASPKGTHRCFGCGHAFFPYGNKPARGRRAWCGRPPNCDEHARKRLWWSENR